VGAVYILSVSAAAALAAPPEPGQPAGPSAATLTAPTSTLPPSVPGGRPGASPLVRQGVPAGTTLAPPLPAHPAAAPSQATRAGRLPEAGAGPPVLAQPPGGNGGEGQGSVSAPVAGGGGGGSFAALLGADELPIDLGAALRLAGVNNPQILLSRQRVVEAVALRQFAAAQLLPSLHLGASYDNHNGNLQQSSGNILKVDRSSLYFGAGASAIAAGTVGIPGVFWAGNVSDTIFTALIARQEVEVRRLASRAVENEMLGRVGVAYTELLRAEGQAAVARRVLEEAREVERLAEAFLKSGLGKDSDYQRALSERRERQAALVQAEGQIPIASARLAELLNLSPTCRLRALDDKVIPCQLVPDPIPLPELLAFAILNRPELQERQAVIRQALLALKGAKVLPFSPNVIIGLSYGGEGGGSNLVHQIPGTNAFSRGDPRFGLFAERLDFDAVLFWTAQNLGVGNAAFVKLARSRLGIAQLQFLERLDRVRAEVANAHARVHARFAQIVIAERAVREEMEAFAADVRAVRGNLALPIELLESLRLLARARQVYLDAIVDYNEAQLELYVAIGQPPADALARPVPVGLPSSAVPPAEGGK
jgi:outer membrane protein TolC